MLKDIEKLIQLRNAFVGLISIYLIWSLQFILMPLPLKEDLLNIVGTVKSVDPISRKNKVIGYQITLNNDQKYTMKWQWLNFRVDQKNIKKISESNKVAVYYNPRCYGFCGNEIYEISADGITIFDYSFLKARYFKNEAEPKAAIPYVFSFFILALLVTHILVKRHGH